MVKNQPSVQETQETRVQSLGQRDPLEEGMATHSRIRAWRILWTEEPGGLRSSWGHKESDTTEATGHKTAITLDADVQANIFNIKITQYSIKFRATTRIIFEVDLLYTKFPVLTAARHAVSA